MSKAVGHFLRQWREFRGLSLEEAAERIALIGQERHDPASHRQPKTLTYATLSRIERGLVPYDQILLEILEEVYQADRASLIMRDPTSPKAIWSIYDQLSPPDRTRLELVAEALRTGTDG